MLAGCAPRPGLHEALRDRPAGLQEGLRRSLCPAEGRPVSGRSAARLPGEIRRHRPRPSPLCARLPRRCGEGATAEDALAALVAPGPGGDPAGGPGAARDRGLTLVSCHLTGRTLLAA